MTDLALRIPDLLLDLLRVLAVFALGPAVGVALIWMLVWLIWRLMRGRAGRCAAQVAAALRLAPATPPDPRMQLWRGRTHEHELWLATCAGWNGRDGTLLDGSGPAFAGGAPEIVFVRDANLLLVARLAEPMPDPFSLSTLRGSEATLRTGDERFDRVFKLRGDREPAVLRVFSSASLRDALLAIYGPDRDPSGTVIMIAGNESGLVVYWSSPRAKRAADFGRAVADAVARMSGRRDFF